uniref:Reverse transcriptase domain-containing protein n=3 Tax=Micrurus TaxID=8634 RepID=A0A2D4K4K6_9SAUR
MERGIPQQGIGQKKEIACKYFEDLYKKEVNEDTIRSYLGETKDKVIGDEMKEILVKDITWSELKIAIENQKNNKTLGTDGIPGELYKAIGEQIGPLMVEIYNEVLLASKISDSWTEVLISLIRKEDSDLRFIQNYRPISLLNTDYTIFATIIANRLKRILNQYIHKDQNGFLPNRQIRNNLRIVLNVLEYYEAHPEKQIALVFLDAQKAFDNLNWQFLIQQIYNMNLGTKFENIVTTIYTSQKANIIINGCTKSIKIEKGVRQGCSLSTLLFILSLETLLTQIRQNSRIKGLKVKKEEYKVQSFADNMVFFIEDPIETGQELLNEIDQSGKVAGLRINRKKTKLIIKILTENRIGKGNGITSGKED